MAHTVCQVAYAATRPWIAPPKLPGPALSGRRASAVLQAKDRQRLGAFERRFPVDYDLKVAGALPGWHTDVATAY